MVIMKNTAMNVKVHISLPGPDINSFGYLPNSEIVGSYGFYF